MMKTNRDKRNNNILELFANGFLMSEIAGKYNLSRQTIHNVISKSGLSGQDGGISVRAAKRRGDLKDKKDKEYMDKYGCDVETYKKLFDFKSKSGRTPQYLYVRQKNNALSRGVPWNIKFFAWWEFWQKSGKWGKRGREIDQYVMCREKDKGAYELGNIYIDTFRNNLVDSHLYRDRKKPCTIE